MLDVIGLLFLLVGAGLVVRAWAGFRGIRASAPSLDPAVSAVEVADGFWGIQKVGVALILVGLAVFVGAWWVARPRAADAVSSEESPEG